MEPREPRAWGAPSPLGGGSIPPLTNPRPGDSMSLAPSVRPQHVAGHPAEDQHDLSAMMLRGRMPRNIPFLGDGIIRAFAQTVVDLSALLRPTSVAVGAKGTLQPRARYR